MYSKVNSRFQIIPVNFKSCYEWLIIYENIFDKLTGQFWMWNLHQSLIHFKHDYANLLNMPTVVFSFPQQILFYVNDFLFGQFQTRLKELYLQRFPCSCIWIRVGQSSIYRLTMSYLALPFIIFFTWLFISIRSSSSTHNPLNGQHLQAIWVVYIRYITNYNPD
jgi:hypothetical protein